jgi:transcriptional regulator with XRE-family HTH domain
MEKTFRRLRNNEARVAYVEAELTNGVAAQIRVMRQSRNWTQLELAEILGTTQNVVSRLEDASYGKFSFQTLLKVAGAFDVALLTRFVPFSQFVPITWNTAPERLDSAGFDEEIESLKFLDMRSPYASSVPINPSNTVTASPVGQPMTIGATHTNFVGILQNI